MEKPVTFDPVAKRTYCRNLENRRETWQEVAKRASEGLSDLSGGYIMPGTLAQAIYDCEVFPAGRWLWIGGTEWVKEHKNHMAGFNCINIHLTDLRDFRDVFDLCCQGCGIGEVLEERNIQQLPRVVNELDLQVVPTQTEKIGNKRHKGVPEETMLTHDYGTNVIRVGDSREGWADAIFYLLLLASTYGEIDTLPVVVDLGYVRPQGEPIKGFGGVSNPVGLIKMFNRIGEILNNAVGRQLTAEEVALIIDEGAEAVVAGNVRRSAGMKQFDADAPNYKEQLYTQDENGDYQVDAKRKALRMSNHTKVHHTLPSLSEVEDSVRNQWATGEGAIQFAPVAIARANRDVLDAPYKRDAFIYLYKNDPQRAKQYLGKLGAPNEELGHRMGRYGLNPCAEIIGSDFACNLSEVQLVNADPSDISDLKRRFRLAALSSCAMLELDFPFPKLERSRQLDPIVGVGFTGWFDFCVKAMGEEWLDWCFQGRPYTSKGLYFLGVEKSYLKMFNQIVNSTVTEYCHARNIKRPNRTTTIKPSGTMSQLSGACPGGHPSKASHFIRRITFAANDPVARACIRAGYSVVPSQRCTDEHGKLLNDPYDERVDEWLVELPVQAEWSKYIDSNYDTQELPAIAQFDIAMTLQKYYAEHNVSFTLEYDYEEIEELARNIHFEMNQGNYVSFAMMQRARADQLAHVFPRLPYEPVSYDEYATEMNRIERDGENKSFDVLLMEEYQKSTDEEIGDTGDLGCSSGKCEI